MHTERAQESINPKDVAQTASNLQREADSIRFKNGVFSEEYSYFNSASEQKLNATGIKSDVAVAWAIKNYSRLNTEGDVGLSMKDLETAEKSSDRFDQIMVKALKEQFALLKNQHKDTVNPVIGFKYELDAISIGDLNTRLGKIQQTEKQVVQDEAKIKKDAIALVMEMAVVQKGEGLWHVAARVLGYDRKQASPTENTEIANLTQQLLVANGGRSALRAGERIPVDQISDKRPFDAAVARAAKALAPGI
jgi:hypothetical protein